MDLSDLESLLEPLSADEPCGPDLEYDAEFGEMDRAAQSKAEQQYGETIVAAEPPDWKDVRKRAMALLERTKDMRVVALLARAALNQDGIVGFQLAMQLQRGYVETYWDSVHPELDHDDDDDPTYRTNTLTTLCDEDTMLRELRETPLVASRAMGRFSLRDIEQARESADHPAEKSEGGAWADDENEAAPKSSGPSIAVIEAAFSDAAIEDIQVTEEATRMAAEYVAAIEQCVTEHVGINFAVSLASTTNLLLEMNKFVVSQLERRGVYADQPESDDESESADAVDTDAGGGDVAAPAAAAQAFQINGKITTRKDAIKALDSVCEFYEENEPSSPLPLLIRRAQRLASKSFLEILRDLAPDALPQAEALGGSGAVESSGDSEETTEESSSW